MADLPLLSYSDNIKNSVQVRFGGYNHTLAAGDGEIYDMENMTSDCAPILATRPPRYLYTMLTKPNGLYAKDKLCWVDGTGFYYDGALKGAVTDGLKTFTAIGKYILVFPDKKYYDPEADIFGDLEQEWSGLNVSFQNGTLYDEAADANAIYKSGTSWGLYFKAGDAVTIEGCTQLTANNKTVIIRDIVGNYMYFSSYAFKLGGTNGDQSYTEGGPITITRAVPDLDYVMENENRVWGGKDNVIYASKLGDPFNWNVFDGLTTDSYYVPVGSSGAFTAGKAIFGYPTFMKNQYIHKIYGNLPTNFQVMGGANLGVMAGSAESIAVAGEIAYYLSRSGPVAYNGGIPSAINKAFGTDKYKNGAAGSDGLKYYISMQDEAGNWHLFVFDTQTALWHREDATHAVGFALTDNLYMLDSSGRIWIIGNVVNPPEDAVQEDDFDWYIVLAEETIGLIQKKSLSKLQVRMELDEEATAAIHVQYNSDGTWHQLQEFTGTVKATAVVPVNPQRCDHYQLKITGTGRCRIYTVGREYATGSDQ